MGPTWAQWLLVDIITIVIIELMVSTSAQCMVTSGYYQYGHY